MKRFFVPLDAMNLDRAQFRSWQTLLRDPDWRERARFLDRLAALVERIPPLEQDMIELYYFHGKRQESIARILGVSQQAVSHRIATATRRMRFMLDRPEVAAGQMRLDLVALLGEVAAVDILTDFAVTSNQTQTARNLGLAQQNVCSCIHAALDKLRADVSVDGLFYATYFDSLLEHRSILREIPSLKSHEQRPLDPAHAG